MDLQNTIHPTLHQNLTLDRRQKTRHGSADRIHVAGHGHKSEPAPRSAERFRDHPVVLIQQEDCCADLRRPGIVYYRAEQVACNRKSTIRCVDTLQRRAAGWMPPPPRNISSRIVFPGNSPSKCPSSFSAQSEDILFKILP